MQVWHRGLRHLEREPMNPTSSPRPGRVARRVLPLAGRIALVLAGFNAIVGATPAAAGLGEGNGEIGVDFGITAFDDDLVEKSARRYAIRLGHHLDESIQVEGQFALLQASEELVPGVDKEATLRLLACNVLLNFHPKGSRAVPYILGGIGLSELDLEAVGISTEDRGLAVQVAAGSRFFFHQDGRSALRVELSFVSNDAFEESYNHLSLTAGVTWRLGSGR